MLKRLKPKKVLIKNATHLGLGVLAIFLGIFVIWLSTMKLPSIDSFEGRKVSQSTKIYDREGKIVLYDIFQDQKRTVIPFEEISPFIKQATISIEDKDFYNHKGVKITAFLRAVLVNLTSFSFNQGGSTITQQVIKKTVLTDDKKPTRKFKEWILAMKLEKVLNKDQIFSIYLNEIPYGGNLYGVEEASKAYFGKSAKDVSLAESAYLASMPQAPSFYSPYGKNKSKLDERKNLVLKEMKNDGYINEEDYQKAVNEKVVFLPKEDKGIKAPHFVMYVKEYLESKYGSDVLESGGLKVTTTLDYSIQKEAEDTALKYALENKKNFNGENASFVAINPKNGNILAMVGSRDYFDKEIDGQFNVSTAHRQPGSTFKPFVYAEAFNKGYTPETILFDVKTQFAVKCKEDDTSSSENGCYSPENYDSKFRGPMTLRDALAQSINIPAVKLLYLTGISDSIELAKKMGITSLGNSNQYGLTLVLGGGEVSLLDMVSAYGVFANEGKRVPYNSILKIEDNKGNILEELKTKEEEVLNPETARKISDILSDNIARTPGYGSNSPLYFANRSVAVKTGTTNDYKDTWIIGYTPNLVVGTWAGNNDNTPMEKKVAGLIVAPMWRALMDKIINKFPNETFNKPVKEDYYSLKPVLRGKWIGGVSNIINSTGTSTISTSTPYESIQEVLTGGVHSILYWLDKNNPRSNELINPENDPQFKNWEYGVRKWAMEHGYN